MRARARACVMMRQRVIVEIRLQKEIVLCCVVKDKGQRTKAPLPLHPPATHPSLLPPSIDCCEAGGCGRTYRLSAIVRGS